jgi:hypothetical protein
MDAFPSDTLGSRHFDALARGEDSDFGSDGSSDACDGPTAAWEDPWIDLGGEG